MRKISLGASIAALAALSSCANKSFTYEEWILPARNSEAVRSVGDAMILQGFGRLAPDIEILSDSQVGTIKIPKGRYPYYTENGTGIWFLKDDYYFYQKKSDNTICVKGNDCVAVSHKIVRSPVPGSDKHNSFQQTLLYSGKIGSRIVLSYREFKDDWARPAFTNTAEYDLSESNLIGYKGARIEVIRASNTEIVYRIVSGFAR